MRVDTYKVLQMCVETGVAIGVHRAHKHTDKPSDEELERAVETAVMDQICEWFRFDQEEAQR